MELLSYTFLGNTLQDWLIAGLIFLLTYLGFRMIRSTLLRRLERLSQRSEKPLDEPFSDLLRQTKPYFVFMAGLFLGTLVLQLPPILHRLLGDVTIALLIIQATFWCIGLIDYAMARRVKADPARAAETATTMNALKLVAKIALWSIAFLLILENVTNIEVGALLAALGIGGIAVALAVQNILGDLFSSVSIALDKPFVIGDAVTIDDIQGNIEYIGLKSTRIRSVTGEPVIFSNSDLLNSRIRNIERLERRRASFTLNVDNQTPADRLAAIPDLLRECVEKQEKVTFDRSHFRTIGEFSLVFDYAYFVEVPDLRYFLDVQQAINEDILRRLKEENINLPTVPGPLAIRGKPLN